MSIILDTYDPNWRVALKEAEDKLSKLYRSDKTSDGLRTTDEIINNPFFRMRQSVLRQEQKTAILSQFKTLEDCTKFHETMLGDVVTEFMQEYITHKGNIRSDQDRVNEAFLLAVLGEEQYNVSPQQLPDSIEALCCIKGAESMSSVAEIEEQLSKQFLTLENDFKAIMQTIDPTYNISNIGKPET